MKAPDSQELHQSYLLSESIRMEAPDWQQLHQPYLYFLPLRSMGVDGGFSNDTVHASDGLIHNFLNVNTALVGLGVRMLLRHISDSFWGFSDHLKYLVNGPLRNTTFSFSKLFSVNQKNSVSVACFFIALVVLQARRDYWSIAYRLLLILQLVFSVF